MEGVETGAVRRDVRRRKDFVESPSAREGGDSDPTLSPVRAVDFRYQDNSSILMTARSGDIKPAIQSNGRK